MKWWSLSRDIKNRDTTTSPLVKSVLSKAIKVSLQQLTSFLPHSLSIPSSVPFSRHFLAWMSSRFSGFLPPPINMPVGRLATPHMVSCYRLSSHAARIPTSHTVFLGMCFGPVTALTRIKWFFKTNGTNEQTVARSGSKAWVVTSSNFFFTSAA